MWKRSIALQIIMLDTGLSFSSVFKLSSDGSLDCDFDYTDYSYVSGSLVYELQLQLWLCVGNLPKTGLLL